MSLIRDLRRWFFPGEDWRKVPDQLINERSMRNAREQERMCIRYNLTRSPQEARRLLEKHQVDSADDLLDILRPYKLTLLKKLKVRAVRLIRRLDGHDTRDLIGERHKYDL